MAAVAGKVLEPVFCTLCSFSSKRLTALEKHFRKVHNTTSQDEWNKKHGGPKTCACSCGTPTKWINWKRGYSSMIAGHNGNIYAIHDKEAAQKIVDARNETQIGKPGWAKGKTKENDERILHRSEATKKGRKAAFDNGTISIWSKGKTKETDERVLAMSETMKNDYASGKRVAWSKGKSEEDDARIKKKNDKLKRDYETGKFFPWSKGLTKETDDRVAKTWVSRDAHKEYDHIRWSNEEIEKQLESNIRLSLEKINKYKNDKIPALLVRCRFCEWTGHVALIFARTDRCPNCQPKGSIGQNKLADWLESLGLIVARNVRGIIGRVELDVFVPSHNFAIEYNGLYYHNEAAGKGEQYHSDKTEKCNKVGIALFHIFEDEWNEKQDIIKSMIMHRLGKTGRKIFARKCKIIDVNNKTRKQFFDANHIDGDTNSLAAFGLIENETLVACISIRKPFHKKHNKTLEVARFATLQGTSVTGGLARLSQAALRHTYTNGFSDGLMTYVDTRHGRGKGYEAAGYKIIGKTSNRFWWTDTNVRFNRFKFRANSKEGLTEAQVADKFNVVKIWGCPNLILELKSCR